MFATSKIAWFLVNPPTVAFFVLAVGTILLFTRRWRAGRLIVGATMVLSAVLMVAPVGTWLFRVLEYRFPPPNLPAHVDGIIVLGGEIDSKLSLAHGQPVIGEGAARLLGFAELARRYPDAKLVFTSGSGLLLDQSHTEAAAMPVALKAVGIDPARVIFENRSRNTSEHALYSRELVKPAPGQVWVMVTSAFHVPRAVGCFRKVGFPVIPYPVDYRTQLSQWDDFNISFDRGFGSLSGPMKEYVGLVAYRLLGYTDALLPGP